MTGHSSKPPSPASVTQPPPPSPSSSAVPTSNRTAQQRLEAQGVLGPRTTVYHPDQSRIGAVLSFLSFAVKERLLSDLLDEAPRRLAEIFHADVVSLYLLEGDGHTLVMRGNHGFSGQALGRVRLLVGEGIAGSVVELMRPIAVSAAVSHGRYRHFPNLGEERYPVYAAVPIVGKSGPLGVTVMQREGSVSFSDADVELLTALAATIAAGVRAAELLNTARETMFVPRKAGGGTRKITLPGQPYIQGRVLGAVAALRRPSSRGRGGRQENGENQLKYAFETARKALGDLQSQAERHQLQSQSAFLSTYLQIVDDARLRSEARRLYEEGKTVAQALGEVASLAVRAASQHDSEFLEERARDIEDVCDALIMLATYDPRAALPSRALLIADDISVFDVLISARAQPAGIALTESVLSVRTQTLLTLWGIPVVTSVNGLFSWASAGDIALLDADHGLLVLNPTRSEIAALRKSRKREEDVQAAFEESADAAPKKAERT